MRRNPESLGPVADKPGNLQAVAFSTENPETKALASASGFLMVPA
jgi:hypothetical protein